MARSRAGTTSPGLRTPTAWPPAPGGEVDLAGEVVAGGPLSPLSVPLFPGAWVFSVSSAGKCPKGMISYRNDNGAWLNAEAGHALALAAPARSPGWTVR